MKQGLYATPKMVKAFRKRYIDKDGEMPDFIETLKIMRKEGALSEEPIPLPLLDGHMSKSEFMEAYDRIPFDASKILDTARMRLRSQKKGAWFHDGRDVVCVQHIHDFGYRKQPVHNYFAVTYMYQGKCDCIFDQKHTIIKPGDLLIVTPGFEHSIHTYPETFAFEALIDKATFNIVFNDFLASHSILSDFFGNAVAGGITNYCILRGDEDDSELRFYLQSFANECSINEVYSNTCAVSLMKLFLGRAFRKYGSTMELYRSDYCSRMLNAESIYLFIRSNYRNITLEQTAEHFHYNKDYLSRFIHEHFGRSFTEIVTSYRIEHAQEYLKKTNKHISDIAALVGYDSADHFSRMFRKCTGMSPAAYRKQDHTPEEAND